jgi:2-keto-4-pentenoate hydratase/2-oxohepta-3-ene-1,7-dioic acid hydratase in catechol pathway
MKIARFSINGQVSYGVVDGDNIKVLRSGLFESPEYTGEQHELGKVKLLAPVEPGKLVCVGLNYRLHAEESGVPVPDEPMLFMCSPQAIIAPGETIVLDNANDRIDYEAEIAVVIGRTARNVSRADAANYIFGYTCANDVSNRDLQRKDGQFTRAKSFDTYKPMGPWIETDLDAENVAITLWQNGQVRQSSNTNDMIFPISRVVEFVSGIMTLLPGDVIITGTPSGVGPMKKGDQIEIEIEGIGRISNPVV